MKHLGQFRPASSVSLGSDGRAAGDLVYVYVYLKPPAGTQTIEPYVWEVTDRDEENHLAVAWVDVKDLETLASLEAVRTIRTVMPPLVQTGSVTTEGDAIHRTYDVRTTYSQNGSGIKVGIISDGVDSRATAQATNDLPPDGSGLTVLNNTVGGDEGTAMLEIVHDMVPDADLYFHDSGTNVVAFNAAIDALVAAGCDVICDDIGWITQPFFEDGIVASHVESVLVSNDIIYASSAGNAGNKHYQGDYYNDGYDFHDFSRGSEPVYKYLYVNIPNNGEVTVVLQWNDEFGSSGNNYDLYLYNISDWSVLTGSNYIQDGDDDPLEAFSYTNTGGSTIAEIDVYNYNGAATTKTLEVFIYPSNGAGVYTNNINATDSIFGHAAVPDAIAVGAIAANDPGNDDIEAFSSQGPVTISYPSPVSRPKPDLSGIDGVTVTGAGGFSSPFYGTSAAAPHVAAIAAQLWGAYPDKTGDEIRTTLYASALDLGSAGYDNVFGYGRADALDAFEALVPPKYSNISRNNTVAGLPTLFSAYWTANVALSGYIFATNNTNGTWVNDSFMGMTGAANWSNVTKTLNSTEGLTIGWRIYANDTSNNWNDTGVQTLTTRAYGVDLTVEGNKTAEKIVAPGVNATYTLTVKNTGNVNDSYNLNVTNPENATTCGLGTDLKMNLTTGILAPEGTLDITLYVANLTEGVFLVNVTVTSVNDSTKFDYVNTTTNVTKIYGVNLTVEGNKTAEKIVAPGVNATYTLTVKNTGNVNDSYNLNVTNPGNASTCGLGTDLKMNLTTDVLAPEGTMDITLYVANSTEGVFPVNVTATSVNDSTKVDYINTTTTVDGRSPTIVSVELDKYEVNQSESINVTVNASDDTGIVAVTAKGIPFSLTSGTATSGTWNGTLTASSIVGTHNVSVEAKDAVDNTATNDTVQYNVSDVTAPEISNVAGSAITTSSATITWTTNEDSDSRVKYGTSSGVYTESKDDLSSTKSHSISLTGLSAGTTYYYVVNSTDLGDNSAESTEHSFKTELPYHPSGGGGSGGPPLDSDADGSLDIAEQLMGTDLYDPCDPYPNCAACVAIRQPAATPEVTTELPPAIQTPVITATPTPTPVPATPTPEEPGFGALFAIAGLFAVAYLVRRKQ